MPEDLVWLLLFPISAILIIAVMRDRGGPVLRIPEGGKRPQDGDTPPSSTWPIGTGPRSRQGA